jgi:hypothetical protein
MKHAITLIILVTLSLSFSLLCVDDQDNKKRYNVKFTNNSTFDITDINLNMNGADETITISMLSRGHSSEYQSFYLPKIPKDEMPKSWGDYSGIYTQQGTVKTIYIFNNDHDFRDEVIIKLENRSYSVEYPDF